MIKLTRFLYINCLTIAMFIIFWFNRRLEILMITYFSMFLHELAHLCAAKYIGLSPSYIAMHPFGVCMRLNTRIVFSLSEEIILYLSGPLFNIIIALIFKCFNGFYCEYGYYCNIALFITNMLPVLPLDGGAIVKRLLLFITNAKLAQHIINTVSLIISLLLGALGVYIVYVTGYNYSVIVLSLMIIGNLFTQKEKYNSDYLKELMYYDRKYTKKYGSALCVIDADEASSPREISKNFKIGKKYLVCITDKDGHINDFKTEKDIMNSIFQT